MLHRLKIGPVCYRAVVSGERTHDIRGIETNIKIGDQLEFHEFHDWNYTLSPVVHAHVTDLDEYPEHKIIVFSFKKYIKGMPL